MRAHITLSLIRQNVVSTTTDFDYIEASNALTAVRHLQPLPEAEFELIVKEKQKAIDNICGTYTSEEKKKNEISKSGWGGGGWECVKVIFSSKFKRVCMLIGYFS